MDGERRLILRISLRHKKNVYGRILFLATTTCKGDRVARPISFTMVVRFDCYIRQCKAPGRPRRHGAYPRVAVASCGRQKPTTALIFERASVVVTFLCKINFGDIFVVVIVSYT